MKVHFNQILLASLLLVLFVADGRLVARACGGPYFYWLESFRGAESMAGQLGVAGDGLDYFPIDEFRFHYPFQRANPAEFESLWAFARETRDAPPPPPSLDAARAAVSAGDLPAAAKHARAVIERFYALPPVVAAQHVKSVLWPAVEIVELAGWKTVPKAELVAFLERKASSGSAPASPALRDADAVRATLEASAPAPASPGPRAASLGFWAIQRAFAAAIPDGWSPLARSESKVPASTFATLEQQVTAWERRFAGHPLRDLVALWRIRLALFAGDSERAFDVALSLYPRRPVRAVAELHYLLQLGRRPTEAQLDGLKDPLLIAAFASPLSDAARADDPRGKPIASPRFEPWLKLALANPRAPWSENLQERLLYSARKRTLSPETLKSITARSPIARKLVAMALAKGGDSAGALAELKALPEADAAPFIVSVHYANRHYLQAVTVPGIHGEEREFLVLVHLTDAELAQLSGTRDADLRHVVNLQLARRHGYAGRWKEALESVQRAALPPDELAAWKEAAKLARATGPDAELKYAAFLEARASGLFDCGNAFVRTLDSSGRDTSVAASARVCSNRWIQLQLYTRWLAAHTGDARARGVLALADRAYARLEYTGGHDTYYWGRTLKTTDVAAELRRLGAIIRGQKAPPSR